MDRLPTPFPAIRGVRMMITLTQISGFCLQCGNAFAISVVGFWFLMVKQLLQGRLNAGARLWKAASKPPCATSHPQPLLP